MFQQASLRSWALYGEGNAYSCLQRRFACVDESQDRPQCYASGRPVSIRSTGQHQPKESFAWLFFPITTTSMVAP